MSRRSNVQGIVARPSAKPLSVILLFEIPDAEGARAFLGAWRAFTPHGDSEDPPGPVFHFAFSWDALEHLLSGHSSLDVSTGRHELEFVYTDATQLPDQPAMREQLGFVGESDPGAWWDGRFTTRDIQLAVVGLFETVEQRAEQLDRLRASALQHGLRELELPGFAERALSGARPAGGRVHFGFRDGVSEPAVDWDDEGNGRGSVDVREFLLGYPSPDYPTTPLKPGPWQEFAQDGSYLGITWIYQDVAAFDGFLTQYEGQAAQFVGAALAREWLAAKLMGRWRDGSPLIHYPDQPPATTQLRNDFDYSNDPGGLVCPLTAHIRVSNCRDQPMNFRNRVRFPKGPPRLIRRGFSYGPAFEGSADDGVDRGLVGLFFCARLNEQLYTILRWLQATEFSDVFAAQGLSERCQDAVLGNRMRKGANTSLRLAQLGGVELSASIATFVRFKGVVPLFVPSLRALAILAGG